MLHVRVALQRSLIEEDNFPEILDVDIRKDIGSTLLPMSESVRLLLEFALGQSVPQIALHVDVRLFQDFELTLLEGVAPTVTMIAIITIMILVMAVITIIITVRSTRDHHQLTMTTFTRV